MRRAPTYAARALTCALLGLGAASTGAEGRAVSYRVVVHPSNEVGVLERSAVSDLFLRKQTRWGDGRDAVPVDQSEVAPVRHAFSKEIHDKSVGGVRRYWQQRMFAGRDLPPPVLGSDEEVLAYVAGEPGAVGYVTAAGPVQGVKVLEVRR